MPRSTTESKLIAFRDKINSTYKTTVVKTGGKFAALEVSRFSSGILSLDVVLGGGWPFGRCVTIAGNESTGKTLITLKAIQEIEKYCHNCRKYKTSCKCGDFTPGAALFADVEGSFDLDWAKSNGFNDEYHLVARPEHAEQAIDVVYEAILENTFDLIVLDSIAALTPISEIENSTEEWQMGMAARLVNKGYRKWVSGLNKVVQETEKAGACVIVLNQIRQNIGTLFGDTRVLPGGMGQKFSASIIIYTKSHKVSDDPETKESAFVKLSGVTHKNKTYVPKMEYTFDMALKDVDQYKIGEVDNDRMLLREGKKAGVLKKVGDGFGFESGGVVVKTEAAFLSQVRHKPDLAIKLWRTILKEACGVSW